MSSSTVVRRVIRRLPFRPTGESLRPRLLEEGFQSLLIRGQDGPAETTYVCNEKQHARICGMPARALLLPMGAHAITACASEDSVMQS